MTANDITGMPGKAWARIRGFGWPFIILAVLFIGYIGFDAARDWWEARQKAAAEAAIAKQSSETVKNIEETNGRLQSADQQAEVNKAVIETLGDMSKTLQVLADADRSVTVKVEGSRKEYVQARSQTQNRVPIGVDRNLSLREREERVLAADRNELYPE